VSQLRSTRTVLGCAVLLLLTGCGAVQGLTPRPGGTLPVKPATAPAQPQPTDLLAQQPTVKPGRSDELLTRSQPRNDDRFDLPPH
jgi:hypothetical protein